MGTGSREHRLRHAEGASGLEIIHPLIDNRAGLSVGRSNVLSSQVPKETLKVTGDKNVHSRGHGGVHNGGLVLRGTLGVATRLDESVEDIVGVGGNDELVDRETHLLGVEAGKDVTKVTGRHNEVDLLGQGLWTTRDSLGQGEERVEVVSDLG